MLLLITAILTLWASRAHGQGRTCDFPEITHGSIYDEHRYKTAFPVAVGKYFYYTCDHGFASPSQSLWTQITCTEEGWSSAPMCLRQCFFPWVENGHSASSGRTHQEGDTVLIVCDSGYSLPNNQSSITCVESGWSVPPECTRSYACVISEEMMEKHKIRLKWKRDKQLYSKTADTVEFICKRGFYPKSPPSAFRVACREGKLHYPTCD